MARRTFSFTDKRILDKIDSQTHKSKYIGELVLDDIENVKRLTEDDVKRIVETFLVSKKINPHKED